VTWTAPSKLPETLHGERVLIVDDESVIALELELVFGDAGAVVVGPASDIGEAMQLARTETLSAAVLDVRLGGRTIAPVVEILAGRSVPFVFYSGQIEGDATLSRWPNAAFIPKPTPSRKLIDTVAGLVGADGRSRIKR
jgi:DNA-binding NtrC family response regulator